MIALDGSMPPAARAALLRNCGASSRARVPKSGMRFARTEPRPSRENVFKTMAIGARGHPQPRELREAITNRRRTLRELQRRVEKISNEVGEAQQASTPPPVLRNALLQVLRHQRAGGGMRIRSKSGAVISAMKRPPLERTRSYRATRPRRSRVALIQSGGSGQPAFDALPGVRRAWSRAILAPVTERSGSRKGFSAGATREGKRGPPISALLTGDCAI